MAKISVLLASVLFIFAINSIECSDDELVVRIKNGAIRGRYMQSKKGRKIFSFLGIRYAKPPLGELRFKPPVPMDDWTGIADATKLHTVCPQRNSFIRSQEIEGDEDCLFLNVYRPQTKGESLLPVMIFIHGGGFFAGGGNTEWFGPDLLLDKDVVLVVPNYRLGILGFLTTGDEVVPGNNGLKDQTLVLNWIQENIEAFGGDPKSVTIFGESAGGASAHLHMLSPLSKGLIHSAISQSGSALCSWAFGPNSHGVKNGRKLAKLLNCPTEDSQEMVDCLRKVDALTFIAQDVHFQEWDTDPMTSFKPLIEPKLPGAFIDEHPIDLITTGRVANPVPWIIGMTTDEGALRAPGLFTNPHLLKELNDDFEQKIPMSLIFRESTTEHNLVANKLREFYFGSKDVTESSRQEVIDLYTDGWFMNAIDQAITLHMKHSKFPIYYYLLAHRGNFSLSTIFGDPVNDYGVCHADDVQYLFNHHGPSPIEIGSRDYEIVELFTTFWSNFAKHKKPLFDQVDDWKRIQDDNEMEYLHIASHVIEMRKGLMQDRAQFWRDLPVGKKFVNTAHDEL